MQRRDFIAIGAAAVVAAPVAAVASPTKGRDEDLARLWVNLMNADKVATRAIEEAERCHMNFRESHPMPTVQETTLDPARNKWSFAATSSHHKLDKALFAYIEDHPEREGDIWKFFSGKSRELAAKVKAREEARAATVDKAERLSGELLSRVTDIEEAIAEAPCRTLDGLRVKVKLLQRWADFLPDNLEALAETMAGALEIIQ